MSEPPAHDKWDANSARLQNEVDKAQVKRILERMRSQFKKFANEAVPPAPRGDVRVDLLERMLGSIFRPPTSPGGGFPADPIEINFLGDPELQAERHGLRTVGEFRVGLAEKAERDEALVFVEVQCLPVEDEGLSTDDPIRVHLSAGEGVDTVTDDAHPDRLTVLLSREVRPKFAFSTDPYRSDWTTRISVSVKEVS